MSTEVRDFSQRSYYPGTTGNPFDRILHRFASVQTLPAPVFALALAVLAALVTLATFPRFLILLAFFLLDWALLARLPAAGRSYGPPRPPVLILAALRSLFAWLPISWMLAVQGLGTALATYGFWIEPMRIRLTRETLVSPKLKPGTSFRLLHLGDLHVERFTRREEQLIALIRETNPDLILFSGDVLNLSYLHDARALADARQVLSQWQASCGAFAVSGSPAVDLEELLPQVYAGLPVRLLRNQRVTVTVDGNTIDLIGIDCSHKPFVDAPILDRLVPQPPENFSLLLYHSPDLSPNAAHAGIDLHLAGHTHGGQVRLPFIGPIYTASLYGRQFQSGRYALKNLTLYITRGIGLEGGAAPRVRFFCPPEIILWEVQSTTP
ncbi:MAG TPA: metallophosphoesterase [Anaerolineaceae bacterium]|nr:metallophosphoesterase [Anaerolineaceae bacterium]